jgi:hypothetical protein
LIGLLSESECPMTLSPIVNAPQSLITPNIDPVLGLSNLDHLGLLHHVRGPTEQLDGAVGGDHSHGLVGDVPRPLQQPSGDMRRQGLPHGTGRVCSEHHGPRFFEILPDSVEERVVTQTKQRPNPVEDHVVHVGEQPRWVCVSVRVPQGVQVRAKPARLVEQLAVDPVDQDGVNRPAASWTYGVPPPIRSSTSGRTAS